MKNLFNKTNPSFDEVVLNRLFADDFAQPQKDYDFYRSRSLDQIKCAISNISNTHSYPELIASVAQANAFIDSAYHLELINLSEKATWVNAVHEAHKNQLIEA